ncbi:large conductance mechanosensitive channel protein MscL [Hymenobacter sp. BRD67]|uniref:large conductance mechanosensitive channel protein MscL n=1 Tax=Hymenobacter sp. BRD67 TaxID=2675877 RepID=UPI001565B18E|nr:large conductance mechanosensitive channel protein MscL [Hymenobacter sp. BRD67]QKG53362.1 large conductance mechanosensitive channel protein MscL [Hymenobacter sp. BRD67]
MSFVSEFKQFISKGNVLDLAVGVIIGGAFGKIVTSLTDDIIMPILSVFTSGVDFKEKFFAINGHHYDTLKAAQDAKAAVVSYGNFINAVIYFLIIAFVIFWVVKMANRFKKPVPVVVAAPVVTRDQELLTEILDALRTR